MRVFNFSQVDKSNYPNFEESEIEDNSSDVASISDESTDDCVVVSRPKPQRAKRPRPKRPPSNQYSTYAHEFVTAKKRKSRLIYLPEEKQLYSVNAPSVYGKTYRCYNRKCKARIILCDDGDVIKLHTAKPHYHAADQEQQFINFKALEAFKTKCGSIESIAGSSKMATVRSIFKRVIEE